MKIKNIGFGILGRERDYRGEKGERRLRFFRPNVALATQKQVPFDKYLLAYQPGQEHIRDLVISDVDHINAEYGRSLDVESIKVDFGESKNPNSPYDFGIVFQKIEELIHRNHSQPNEKWYLNIGTGTHAMQFAMFFMVDKKWFDFPVELIQPRPGQIAPALDDRSNEDEFKQLKKKSVTVDSIAYEVKINWPELKEYQQNIDQKREEYVRQLLPAEKTTNKLWHQELRQIGAIGKETNDTILLRGETGTGKSLLAKRIHEMWVVGKENNKKLNEENSDKSKKKDGNKFVAANCAGFDSTLIDSELFGHVEGAFTGAIEKRVGLLEEADGGTLFLDEIGEMPLSTQAKLLKVLEEKTFRRVGDTKKVFTTTFRLICATNRDLTKMVRDGKFRLDLYTRIRNWEFVVPPLRELADDLESLIDYQLKVWNADKGKERRSKIHFNDHAYKTYLEFARNAKWPGNYRDLAQSINRLATYASVEEFGGPKDINEKMVKEEIARLNKSWVDEGISCAETYPSEISPFIRHLKDAYPAIGLVDAAEMAIRKWALVNNVANKAASANEIYLVRENDQKNPSAVFSRRGNYLRKKYPDSDNII